MSAYREQKERQIANLLGFPEDLEGGPCGTCGGFRDAETVTPRCRCAGGSTPDQLRRESEHLHEPELADAVVEHVRATGLLKVPGEHVITIGHDVPGRIRGVVLERVAERVQEILGAAVEVDAPRALLKDALLVRTLRPARRAGECRHGLHPSECPTCEKYLNDSPEPEDNDHE